MKTAITLIGLSVTTCVNLYVLAKSDWRELVIDPWLTYSQIAALVGTVMLAWTFILSSRLPLLEGWLGPMDKLYRLHHLLGAGAFSLIGTHPIALALRNWGNPEAMAQYLLPLNNWVWLLGWVGLQSMVALLFLTLVVRLPYQIWKRSHQLMGVALGAVLGHVWFISSDVSRYSPLRWWIIGWLVTALIVSSYLKMIYPRRKHEFEVKKVRRSGEIVEIILEATGESMRYEGGQFVFVSFEGMEEEHPFSIAGGDGKELRLGIKISGDYTNKLTGLKVGTKTEVRGPYGKLGQNFGDGRGVVLIGGGIGATPMLGMMDQELREPKDRPIDFIYAVRSKGEAYGLERLLKFKSKKFRLHVWESDNQGRIQAKDIIKMTDDYKQKRYIICGPRTMMEELSAGLVEAGVKRERVEFEDFALK